MLKRTSAPRGTSRASSRARTFGALVLGASLASCLSREPGPVEFDATFREDTFDLFFDALEEEYPYFDRLDFPWEERVDAARAKALSASTRREFVHSILEPLTALKDPHVTLRLPYENYAASGEPWTVPSVELALVEGALYVVSMPAPFPQLLAIDGLPPRAEMISAQFAGPPETDVRLDLAWPDGRRESQNVRRWALGREPDWSTGLDLRWDHHSWISWARVGDLGVLRLVTFSPGKAKRKRKEMARDIELAFESLGDVEDLLLDLQSNTGGLFELAELLGGYLVEEPILLGRVCYKRFGFFAWPVDFKLTPNPDRFRGDLVVLVDGYTGSSAEHLTSALQRTGRATVIGERTMGAEAAVGEVEADDGTTLAFGALPLRRTGVESFQGIGIIPDLRFPLRVEDVQEMGIQKAQVQIENERIRAALHTLGSEVDWADVPHPGKRTIRPKVPIVRPRSAAPAPQESGR